MGVGRAHTAAQPLIILGDDPAIVVEVGVAHIAVAIAVSIALGLPARVGYQGSIGDINAIILVVGDAVAVGIGTA